MDPASAVGTASAVLSFVGVTYQFIRVAYSIAKATDAGDGEFSSMEATAAQVKAMSEALSAESLGGALPQDVSQSVLVLARECKKISTKILERIERTRPKHANRVTRIAMAAIQTLCSRDELASLQASLDSCSAQLRFVVQSNHSAQVSEALDRLESSMDEFKDQQQSFRERANEQYILGGISFQRMKQRQNEILSVSDSTFRWIFKDTAEAKRTYSVMFKDWLARGTGIFHVSGKLGSGKSALMKQIVHHDTTRSMLGEWAGSATLAFGSCFFWKPGTKEQRNTAGLLRSLLYDILSQQPTLIPFLFPGLWKPSQHSVWAVEQPLHILDHDITRVFHTLTDASTLLEFDLRICFFIDGLDEFDDDHEIHIDLVDRLNDWVRVSDGRVKLCVSSREYPVFQERLATSHRIRMQDLNHQDISNYVIERLQRQTRDTLCLSNAGIKSLYDEIVWRSEGIFLWTTLVMKLVGNMSLRPRGPVDHVLKVLQSLPRELKDLVGNLLESVPEFERRSVATCFLYAVFTDDPNHRLGSRLMAIRLNSPLLYNRSILRYHFLRLLAGNCGPSSSDIEFFPGETPAKFTAETLYEALQSTKDWILGECKGLLEITNANVDDSGTTLSCPREASTAMVGFTHRAVQEYVIEYVTHTWSHHVSTSDIEAYSIKSAICVVRFLPLPRREILRSKFAGYRLDDHSYIKIFQPSVVDLLVELALLDADILGTIVLKSKHAKINRLTPAVYAASAASFQVCHRLIQAIPVSWTDRNACFLVAIHIVADNIKRILDPEDNGETVAKYTEHVWPLLQTLFEQGIDLGLESGSFLFSEPPWNRIVSICSHLDHASPAKAVDFIWQTLQMFVEHSRVLPSFSAIVDKESAIVDKESAIVDKERHVYDVCLLYGDKTLLFVHDSLRSMHENRFLSLNDSHPFFASFETTATLADFVRFCHPPNEDILLTMIQRIEEGTEVACSDETKGPRAIGVEAKKGTASSEKQDEPPTAKSNAAAGPGSLASEERVTAPRFAFGTALPPFAGVSVLYMFSVVVCFLCLYIMAWSPAVLLRLL